MITIADKIDWRQVIMGSLLILLLGVLVYSNTFRAPFFYDDIGAIVANPAVHNLDLTSWQNYVGVRALPQISLALNYRLSELNVASYHAVNLVIHLLTALILFIFIYRLAGRWKLGSRLYVALFSALLFVVHPLLTESVTYIVQRITIMAAMFYLLSLWTFLEWRLSDKRRWWWAILSIIAALAAMNSKEIAVTLPLAIVWLEFWFFINPHPQPFSLSKEKGDDDVFPSPWIGRGVRGEGLRRLIMLTPWLLLLLYIPWLMFSSQVKADTSLGGKAAVVAEVTEGAVTGQQRALPRATYFYTQLGILPNYLRLAVWPSGQNVDHDPVVYKSIFRVGPLAGLTTLAIMGGLILWSRRQHRMISFGLGLFVLAWVLESTVFPLAEAMVEYRMYLPMAGLVIAMAGVLSGVMTPSLRQGFGRQASRSLVLLGAIIILLLGFTTYQRNQLWRDPILLWQDAAVKSPEKARPPANIGSIYLIEHENYSGAQVYLERAIDIDPGMAAAHGNLGTALINQGQLEAGAASYIKARELDPNLVAATNNLAQVYMGQEKWADAEQVLNELLQTDPLFFDGYNNLGIVYVRQSRMEQAEDQFIKALEINPDYEPAVRNLQSVQRLRR